MKQLLKITSAILLVAGLAACTDNSEPELPVNDPLYRPIAPGECSSGERGSMMMNEIHWAGSVRNDGTYDADDVFIELWNRHPRPINISGWRLNIWRDTPGYTPDTGHLIPPQETAIEPNGFAVIVKKSDGAFSDVADIVIEDLEIGKKFFRLELRDCTDKLMEDAGSRDYPIFNGGYDTVTARSMERAQVIFQNRGGADINWHAFSINEGTELVNIDYRENTLASPGSANSPDYSGSASSGNFE